MVPVWKTLQIQLLQLHAFFDFPSAENAFFALSVSFTSTFFPAVCFCLISNPTLLHIIPYRILDENTPTTIKNRVQREKWIVESSEKKWSSRMRLTYRRYTFFFSQFLFLPITSTYFLFLYNSISSRGFSKFSFYFGLNESNLVFECIYDLFSYVRGGVKRI